MLYLVYKFQLYILLFTTISIMLTNNIDTSFDRILYEHFGNLNNQRICLPLF